MPSWPCVVHGIVSRLQNKNKNVVIGSFNDLAIPSSIFKKVCGFKLRWLQTHTWTTRAFKLSMSSRNGIFNFMVSIFVGKDVLEMKMMKAQWQKIGKFSASCIIQYIRKFINLSKVAKWIILIQVDNIYNQFYLRLNAIRRYLYPWIP